MFMERIEVAAETATKRKPKGLKLVVGLAFMIVSALLMAPWLCLVALWVAAATLVRVTAKIGRTVYDSACYAGELVVGR
jgi:energy-coupling factor transporter transmembrane protein EcfT